MSPPLAHSPRPPYGPQPYREHSCTVEREARGNAARASKFYVGDRGAFVDDVAAAASYHDLGKLDAKNQDVLRQVSGLPLPVAHVDAGVAHLLDCGLSEAAVLVAAHHAGLFDEIEERKKPSPFRNLEVALHVDRHRADYTKLHEAESCPVFSRVARSSLLHRTGLERRIALSCLVDADHGDTARHYGNEPEPHWPDPGWADRLRALNEYVAKLPRASPRDADREGVYVACRNSPVEPGIRSCDAPVGSGKTTAVMAHLLRVAAERRLRHVFVVLPYINIVRQSVETYRKAIVLPGEDPQTVIAEHDHQADFDSVDSRQLATLWRSPIIVTTAVQFFETIGSHHPARLRKLHELAGSAVFVDEAHAALPAHLWPQMWLWLEEWVSNWGGHIVLASGSLPRFWELPEFVDPPKTSRDVPDLVPEALRSTLVAGERFRVAPRTHETALTLDSLVDFAVSKPGPRIIVLNTVQSAAIVADRVRSVRGGNVLHLSTALTPTDRSRILARVDVALASATDSTLVATSCVEAGLDISFRTGFRETATAASLIQIGGRVNRRGSYDSAEVWDFCIDDPLLPNNPQLEVAQRVLRMLFADGKVGTLAASELALEAMRREVTQGQSQRSQTLRDAEARQRYPEVGKLCRVIDNDSRFVIVDKDLASKVQDGQKVPVHELLKGSVRIWARKLARMPTKLLRGDGSDSRSIYVWTADYDPDFLGYMVGQLGQTVSFYIA